MKYLSKLVLLILAALLLSGVVFANDPAKEFSLKQNPNGVWAYGYSPTLGGTFIPFDHILINAWQPRDDSWYEPELNCGWNPNVGRDLAENYTTPDGCGFVPPGTVHAYPGCNDENAVLRWTAPLTGTYNIRGYWQANQGGDFCQSYRDDYVDVHILVNSSAHLLDKDLDNFGATVFFDLMQNVTAGTTLDFSQGWGDHPGNQYPHGANLQLTIDFVPTVHVQRSGSPQIAVAILSDEHFNAPLMVLRSSLTFGRIGNEQSLLLNGESCTTPDVNGDGRPDLVCLFDVSTSGFMPGDTQAVLQGQTRGGITLRAIVPFSW